MGGQFPAGRFRVAADVVDLAGPAAAQHQVGGRAVVRDVEPLADIGALPVQRDTAALQKVRDEARYGLLRTPVRTVVVSSTG
ncbi:hypothetical protein GCM10023079_28650 [Streptomyces chitinivorans]